MSRVICIDAAGSATATDTARIGPNAVTRLAEALIGCGHGALATPVFAAAGVADWLARPPSAMVAAQRAGRLHAALRDALPPAEAATVMAEAGRLTANYLLAARIPRPAQAVLRLLPPSFAARALVPAIRAHAWTFAGAGRFVARAGRPTMFEIAGNPLCALDRAGSPVCAWHAAVFERLFQALVSSEARATEIACEACGDASCRFLVAWPAAHAATRS